MAEREYPRGWLTTLPHESERWVTEGIISDDQRAAMLRLYPASPMRQDRTVLVISILGSLLLGLGVILFFAANWPRIPSGVKVGAILLATAGAHAAGFQLARGSYPRLGQSLIFLGSLLYGAGIWLIAQIFHLDSHFPAGFLLWGVGVLPLAWAANSRPVLYLATLVLAIWTGMEQITYHTYNLLLPVVILGGVVLLARRLQSRLAEAGGLLTIGFWLTLLIGSAPSSRAGHLPELQGVTVVLLMYGLALMTLGLARIGSPRVYLGIGTPLVMLVAYLLTFRHTGLDWLPIGELLRHSVVLVPAAAGLAIAVGGLALYLRRPEAGRIAVLGALGLLLVASLLLPLAAPVVRMVGFNLVLLAEAIGLVVFGIGQRSELLVNLGLVAFVVHVFTRYVDFFFDAMDKSLFFIGVGVLLLGGGWLLERNRRRWLREMGGERK